MVREQQGEVGVVGGPKDTSGAEGPWDGTSHTHRDTGRSSSGADRVGVPRVYHSPNLLWEVHLESRWWGCSGRSHPNTDSEYGRVDGAGSLSTRDATRECRPRVLGRGTPTGCVSSPVSVGPTGSVTGLDSRGSSWSRPFTLRVLCIFFGTPSVSFDARTLCLCICFYFSSSLRSSRIHSSAFFFRK